MSAPDDFHPVSRDKPCVICGNDDWCRRTASGAHECHRIHEDAVNEYKRVGTTPGEYTVYRCPEDQRARNRNRNSPTRDATKRVVDVDLAAENRKFRDAITPERKTTIAQQLGVSVAALESIGIGRAEENDLKRLRASGRGWRDACPPVVSSFPEFDAAGAVVGFGFRADDGSKGSPSGNVGAKRGLVIPSTLLTRIDPVLVVEGPTDVAACETLGLASVGRPSSTSGGKHIAQLLSQRDVLIVGENDQKPNGNWPGREGAEKLARCLATTWKRAVRWVLPPDEHKDVRAYLQDCVANNLDLGDEHACREAGKQFVERMVEEATEEQPPATSSGDCGDNNGAREVALRLCEDSGDLFFHDNEQCAFVVVREGGAARTLSVKSREYALLLGRRYYRETDRGLSAAAKTEAIAMIEGWAIFDGPEESVFLRIGEFEDKIVLDLCDEQCRVVVIDQSGWKIVNDSPVRFRRTRGMFALPAPVPGGSIAGLRPFINVQNDDDFVLVCAFILGCFHPRGPFVILLINGEQGSAKSTLCRFVRAVIDPNKAPIRSEPKNIQDLAIAANNSWMIVLDNMSLVSERTSNAICRLATGGGFATRQLFTDTDETIFDAKRPVMINGIGNVADRSDLIDRAVRVTLPTIPDHRRQTEKNIWSEFEKLRPGILGAFLHAVSAALRNQADVRLAKLPRMADFATWVVAAEPACPWPKDSFMEAFDDQRRDADEYVIETSPIAKATYELVEKTGEIKGAATEILERLSADKDQKILNCSDWPKSPAAFGTKLREVTPNLRRVGIDVVPGRSRSSRTTAIRKNDEGPNLPSSLSPPSPGPDDATIETDGEGSDDSANHGKIPPHDPKTPLDTRDETTRSDLEST